MKKIDKRKRGIIYISIGAIIAIFLSLSIVYIHFIKNTSYENVYDNLTEISEQTASQLHQSIENQMKFVGLMVDFINGGYINTLDDIFKRFINELDNYHFTRLVILNEEGNGITSDGYKVNNYPNIEEFFIQDGIYLSENRPSTVSQGQVNIYAKTFIFNNKKYVLFATINTSNYKEILSRPIFNGEGGTYLINEDGLILIDSFDKAKDNVNFFSYIKEEYQLEKNNDIAKIEQMKEDIINNKNGTFAMGTKKQINFVHYEKVGINNWYVISTAPDNMIAKELTTFLGVSLSLCLIINIVIIAIFIYVFYGNQKLSQKLYETAYIDAITGLGNEVYFKENGLEFINSNNKNKYILILDIDKFKVLNTNYDYRFCNEVLKEVGKRLTDLLKEKCIVSRLSKDVYGASFIYNGEIKNLLEKIFHTMNKITIEEEEIMIHLSIGVYKIKSKDHDINKVIDKAYIAHAKSKNYYGNSYYIFDEELEQTFNMEEALEKDMEKAILNNEFKVYYQPKIYVKDESLAGAEALVRWHKDKEIIPPNKFIPLFEKNKFIIKLDLHIFELVCQDMANWEKEGLNVPSISVNVSKEHFVDEDFIDKYVVIADKYNIDKGKIELEITESATVDESINILKIIEKIKKKGFIVSLDDFGAGYTSLSMLQNLPIDIIKIDKIFLDKADLKSEENIINDIVYIARRLGKKTIVEGVETKEQVEFIKTLESDVIQGFYYSKPITRKAFSKYL